MDYDYNLDDYSAKRASNYKKYETSNEVYDKIQETDWKAESQYHNTYRINGKNVIGRTIKLKKK